MTKIFADSEEKFVKTVVLHTSKNDPYVYFDEAKTAKVDSETLINLVLNGVFIEIGGSYFKAIGVMEADGYSEACFYDAKGNYAGSSPAFAYVKSSEYTPG